MKKQSTIKWDDSHYNLIKNLRAQKKPLSLIKIAKLFGSRSITPRMIQHQLTLSLPSKRVRKGNSARKAKVEMRVQKVKKLAKTMVKVTQLHSGKQYNTSTVPKYPTCQSIAQVIVRDEEAKIVTVSAEQVRLWLRQGGMRAFHQPKTIMLTNGAKTKRVTAAKKNLGWPKMKKVFFSDETLVDRNAKGRQFQWAESRSAKSTR